jgi:hypothetical protein
MEIEKSFIGSVKERINHMIKALEECKNERDRLKDELENLKRKYAEILRELEEMKELIDSALSNEG